MATSNNSSVTLIAKGNIKPNRIAIGGGKGGVSNYELLTHKPSINGHELIGNKTNADLGIPTDTQDLTNTAGFITKIVDDLVNYYTKLEIDDIINEIKQSSFRIVDDLPLVGDPGVIYLILNATPQSRNYYDEYIYADNRWEKIGTTEIDLSGYVTDEELTQVLRSYITNEALNEALRNYYNKADVNLLLADKANSADLAAVATSGSYNDLQNKPDIPDDLADLNEDTTHRTVTDAEKIAWNNKSDFSGSYNDLTNKPTIPDELADLTDDTTHRLVTDTEKSTWNAKSDFSGSYNDLTNKPTIPDELADLSDDVTHRLVTDTEKQTWNNKSDFSGSYNDLTDKPDIPTVYNSTITIQKNNQNIDSFTLNQSSNKSINMSVPEKTSDIQNDSGFITNTVNNLANYYLKSETYTKTEVSNLINAAVSGRFQKVNALPAQGEANVIYLVPKATVLVNNVYDEYIWEDDSWELIGDTQIDLSGYVTDADLTAALQSYVTSATFNTTISNYYTKTEIGILLADKVDKVDGKGLSTYDYDAAAKAIVDGVTSALNDKVDKVQGKGLSTNDYDNTAKGIVDGVTSALADKVDKVNGKGLSTEDYTTAEKNKLAGIAEGAEVNVQSDWDETDDTQDDYIKNKPEAYDAIWENNDILEGVSDVQPYLYRATNKPEGAIEYVQEKLIGGSVAYNQLVNLPSDTYTRASGIVVTRNSDGSIRFVSNGSNTADDALHFTQYGTFFNFGFNGHKVLLIPRANKDIAGFIQKAYISPSASWTGSKPVIEGKQLTVASIISVPDGYYYFIWYGSSGANLTYDVTLHPMLIDLTQMFGTAIADLAYSKEQALAGSGIAWLKSYGFFTKDYYPYNAGALQSVKTGSKKVVGKNLASKITSATTHTQYSMCLFADGTLKPNTTYVISFKGTTGNTIYPNEILFTTQSYYTIVSGNNTLVLTTKADISKNNASQYSTVNQGWILFKNAVSSNADNYFTEVMIEEGYQATSYEPYTSTTYPLDSDLELRGLYKLDASNNIICDGDEYTPDGNVKRRYGIVDLGSLDWTKYDTTSGTLFRAFKDNIIYYNNQFKIPNFICSKYITISSDIRYEKTLSQAQAGTGCVDIVDSSYTDATAFKTAMSGVYLIYELATETTDSADSYQNPQIIHENGTEEFIDTRDYPLPVGHDTGYFTASDEKFFLPPVVDNDGRFLYHDGDGFQFKNFNQVASKVEESDINGNIKIDGTETQVYDDSELQGIVDTDTTVVTGNPLNFSTKSAQNAVNTDIVIDPVQDLHGFTKPWVGGAGKNLQIGSPSFDNYDGEEWGKDTSTYNGHEVYKKALAWNGLYKKVYLDVGTYTFSLYIKGDSTTSVNLELVGKGATATVTNGTTSINVSETWERRNVTFNVTVAGTVTCRVQKTISDSNYVYISEYQLEKNSQATTYEPYENICPISPKEQIAVQGCGKNLFNSKILMNGTQYLLCEEFKVKPGTYNFIFTNNSSNMMAFWARSGYDIADDTTKFVNAGKTVQTTYEVTGEGIVAFGFRHNPIDSTVQITDVKDVMFLVSTETDLTYEPYTPSNNFQIPLPNDFYGGTLNLESGELRVENVIVDFGNLNYGYDSVNTRFTTNISGIKYNTTLPRVIQFYSSCYNCVHDGRAISQIVNGDAYIGAGSPSLYIHDYRYNGTTLNDFKTAITGQTLCYPLATPFVINLTPQQLNLLKATNNISTDAKTISVTYRNGELSTYAPATDIADGLLSATDKRAIDRTSDIVEGNPVQFSTESKQIARSTIVDLEPIQDLHGYSKPWVGGAGKNLLPMTVDSIKSANISGTWDGNVYNLNSLAITLLLDVDNNLLGFKANGTPSAETVLNMPRFTSDGSSYTFNGLYPIDRTKVEWAVHDVTTINADNATVTVPSGNRLLKATFINGANINNATFYPMIRLSTVTDVTFEPYTNIASISGYDNVDINGCGKNLFDESAFEQGLLNYITGELGANAWWITSDFIKVSGTVSISGYKDGTKGNYCVRFCEYDAHKNFIKNTNNISAVDVASYNKTIILDSNTRYVRASFGFDNKTTTIEAFFATNRIQIEKNSQPTPYTPYQQSNNISIQLDDTVYGGKLDVEKGELVVDRAIVDLGDLSWVIVEGDSTHPNIFANTSSSLISNLKNTDGKKTVICSQYNGIQNMSQTPFRGSSSYNGCVCAKSSSSEIIMIQDSRYTDATTFSTNMDGVQLVYELATPTTIQLTPHAINLLKGVNTITTNGTSITLNYRNGEVATLEDVATTEHTIMNMVLESQIFTDTVTGTKYKIVVTNGVLSVVAVNE